MEVKMNRKDFFRLWLMAHHIEGLDDKKQMLEFLRWRYTDAIESHSDKVRIFLNSWNNIKVMYPTLVELGAKMKVGKFYESQGRSIGELEEIRHSLGAVSVLR